jgi:arylsulfatase/arylsulfatase A
MRSKLLLLLLPFLGACTSTPDRARADRPNVVIVITDDQGFGDYGVHGNPVLATPHLDALAAAAPTIARAYVSPVCSPTRASLMTGRWNYRTRVVDTYVGRSNLEPDEVTLAEVLQAHGYRTGIFGKWHLGDCHPLRPIDQGFDTALVHRGGGLAQPSEPLENGRRYTDPILFANGEAVTSAGFCTDVFFDAARDFITGSVTRGEPFLAYVATNAPHGPFHDVPEALRERYAAMDLSPVVAGRGDPERIARVYAMIENIDTNVGRLRAHLEELGIARDTVFVFLGDNGPEPGRFNAGLRGTKSTVYEGGIRTPLWFVREGDLVPGARVPGNAAHVDVMPTVLDLVGVPVPDDLDGRSLAPWLRGEDAVWEPRTIVVQAHRGDVPEAEHQFALVQGRWKLLRASGFGRQAAERDHPFELYDLDADPGEQHDLAADQPLRVERLRRDYTAWWRDVASTRPDNFAPPRIRVGSDAEPVTVLTRQDWRERAGGGWGTYGEWPLFATRDGQYRLKLVFRDPVRPSEVRIDCAAGHVTQGYRASDAPVTEIDDLLFPANVGPTDLLITVTANGERFGPYQAEVSYAGPF